MIGCHNGIWGFSIRHFSTLPFKLAKNVMIAKEAPQKMQSFCAKENLASFKGGVQKNDVQSF